MKYASKFAVLAITILVATTIATAQYRDDDPAKGLKDGKDYQVLPMGNDFNTLKSMMQSLFDGKTMQSKYLGAGEVRIEIGNESRSCGEYFGRIGDPKDTTGHTGGILFKFLGPEPPSVMRLGTAVTTVVLNDKKKFPTMTVSHAVKGAPDSETLYKIQLSNHDFQEARPCLDGVIVVHK